MNIPDTINDARIRALVEPYAAIRKIQLRPDHQGAIVELVDVEGAGKASLALEGYEIVPGRKISVGSVGEMMKMKEEVRSDRIQVGVGKKDGGSGGAKGGSGSGSRLQPQVPVRRPGAGGLGGGRGRRGGLGFLSRPRATAEEKGIGKDVDGDVDMEKPAHADVDGEKQTQERAEGSKAGVGKSNDDFRAMLMGGK
jgi:squamous cell carcinoma antigen recognized by T-cells 3